MPDLSWMWKLRKQTTHVQDKGPEPRAEHSPARAEVDDGENLPDSTLSWRGKNGRASQVFVNFNPNSNTGVYDFHDL